MTFFLNTKSKQNNILLYKDQFKYLKTTHSFHLVDPSPWPAVAALGAFMITSGGVLYMHKFFGGWNLFVSGFLLTFYVMYTWWRDVVREATFEEQHTVAVQKGLRLGMILFIVSEVMFFFAFFWAFFHSSIAPVFNIGGVWPPKAITPMDTYTIPLTNTFFLLTSGATVTWAHHALVARAKKQALLALIFTLVLASLFTSLQGLEYVEATFNISDGIYGSCFYMATGFHGFHVFVGTIALFVSFVRIIFNHFTDHHHFGFESAIWYWHFVDVVWLFLFINVYWWSNSGTDLLPTPTGNVLELKSTPIIGTASWLFSTISDEDFIILKVYLLLDFFLEILSVLIFFCLIIFNIKTKLFFKDLLKFGSTLPFINKIALYIFTAAYAVPNRIWINHGINSYIVTLLVFLLFFFSNTFPVLTLVVVNYSALIVESLLVAYLYTGNSAFKSFIDKTLFANDSSRAKAYFSFFWGS